MQNWKKRQQGQITEKIRRADIVLVAACMLTAVLVGALLLMHRREGNVARISCDGEELAVIAFGSTGTQYCLIDAEDGRMTIESYGENPVISDKKSFNLLAIADGVVRMEAADCRDQICVRHRAVSAEGESIICLPHKLVVEIAVGAEYSGLPEEGQKGNRKESSQSLIEETLDGMVE